MNIRKFLTDTSVNTQGHKMKCTQCSDIKPTIRQLCYGNRKTSNTEELKLHDDGSNCLNIYVFSSTARCGMTLSVYRLEPGNIVGECW